MDTERFHREDSGYTEQPTGDAQPADQLAMRREITEKLIAELRTRLLDLRNNNRLLNLKFSDRTRTHVRVIDEVPDVLFAKLLSGVRLTFAALPEPDDKLDDESSDAFMLALGTARRSDEEYLEAFNGLDDEDETSAIGQRIERALKDRVRASLGLPPRPTRETVTPADHARSKGFDPSYDLPILGQNAEQNAAHLDDRIQTLLFPDQMERKLSGIRDGARTYLSEIGVNTLYAVFGCLEWYESDASDRRFFAPLLLHPLEIDRSLVRRAYRYTICSTGEETETNLTLRERLARDFHLALPEWDEQDTPDSYFSKVEETILDMKRWRVRRFVTVGLFSFGRIAMYHDLDPKRWPKDKALHLKPLLVELLGGSQGDSVFSHEYDLDDPEIAAEVPLLITDADSSQFAAILEVMRGRNLAIKGPPGTGKSQTITNLIAAALVKGLKVLFVSEKMAALEVVKKRLDEAGLGEFCLELHSTKARKKDVLESLQRRLDVRPLPEPDALALHVRQYEDLRRQLTAYAELINQPYGQSHRTLQELFWAGTRARARARELDIPASLDGITIDGPADLSIVDIEERRRSLIRLEEHAASLTGGVPERHPWSGVCRADLSPFDYELLIGAFKDWHASLVTLAKECVRARTDFGLQEARSAGEAALLVKALSLLPEDPDRINFSLLAHLASLESLNGLLSLMDQIQRANKLLESITPSLEATVIGLPQPEDLRNLDARVGEITLGGERFDGTFGDLSKVAQRNRDLAGETADWIAIADHLHQVAGVSSTPTISSLLTLFEAANVLRSTPREILLNRFATILEETAAPHLDRAAKEERALNARRMELAEVFSFSGDEQPELYRECASALRSAGFLGRIFNGDFRRAKKVWRGARKVRRRATPDETAGELDQLSNLLEGIRQFRSDERLRHICGPEFRGLATDFDLLIAANQFARRIEQRFPGSSSCNPDVRRFLLTADLATLDVVLAEVEPETVSSFQKFIDSVPDDVKSLDYVALDLVHHIQVELAERAESVCQTAAGIGLKNDLRVDGLRKLADRLQVNLDIKAMIEGNNNARQLLGTDFDGLDTDTAALQPTVEFARTLHSTQLEPSLHDTLFAQGGARRSRDLRKLGSALEPAIESLHRAQEIAVTLASLDPSMFFGKDSLSGLPLEALAARVEFAISSSDIVTSWIEYNRLRIDAEDLGLRPLLDAYGSKGLPRKHLEVAFDHVFHQAILRHAYSRHPELARFSGTRQQSIRRRFQEIDTKIIELMRRKLAGELSHRQIPWGYNWGPKREWTDLCLIQNEIGKKKRHIPLRDLLLRAGTAVQQMKPCWMMSPASVAQFVRPGGSEFDLVVIDEASQMRPEEALGAVGRAGQLVVVGDPKQLPPTAFFERTDTPDEDEEVDEHVDNESILDRALSVFHPSRELLWHYRSRHESLIAFSNHYFYDDKLVVFASPFLRGNDYGVEYRRVEGAYTPKASVNMREGKAVAEAAVQFMGAYPNRSLGVVTMNQPQREILSEEMDRLFARDSRAEAYRKQWEGTLEPFFVKNLENVQGDERDVIFISTVYGPERRGSRVAQRFGPINSPAGHRRLNVLFTRAKEKVIVFSSMNGTDVIPTETSQLGVATLKNYLNYAAFGQLDVGEQTGRAPDSDFEIFVAERLRQYGYEVIAQLGVSGYFIDLAVRDPRDRDRFLLGIECDGATYHSAKSARDRDRLREEILTQRMKWSIYRIWSTDWFADPDAETEKLIRFINGLLNQG